MLVGFWYPLPRLIFRLTLKLVKTKGLPATINRELSALKRMLNMGARQTPPKVDRVPYIPMLKENNTRKGFFEHGDFIALRDKLPDYLKGFVTFAYEYMEPKIILFNCETRNMIEP